jgi:hypothetical protein
MSQDTFSLFLQDALKQSEPQMLMFVFARFVLADDATAEQKLAFEKGEGGRLLPVSCANSFATGLSDFNSLSTLSNQIERPWDVVFISTIIETNSQKLDAEHITKVLKDMVDFVANGQVNFFLALNQRGERLSFD